MWLIAQVGGGTQGKSGGKIATVRVGTYGGPRTIESCWFMTDLAEVNYGHTYEVGPFERRDCTGSESLPTTTMMMPIMWAPAVVV